MRVLVVVLACVALRSSAEEPLAKREPASDTLVERRFDRVCFAATHNAMSARERRWIAPNQNVAIPGQLARGFRCLLLDVHLHGGEPVLCHGPAWAGRQRLVDGLLELRAFLVADPDAVVTVVLESYAPADVVARAFADTGLDGLAHVQRAGEPWPTLGAMVRAGRRLVVLSDRAAGGPTWYHATSETLATNHWAARNADELSIALTRGRADAPLVLMNHFVTHPIALEPEAARLNAPEFLAAQVRRFTAVTRRVPNFVAVDFGDRGDVVGVVDRINAESFGD